MIQQQLKTILTESGLEEIDAAGKPFDPALHEAVSQQETAEVPGRSRQPAIAQGLQAARPAAAPGHRHRRQETRGETGVIMAS